MSAPSSLTYRCNEPACKAWNRISFPPPADSHACRACGRKHEFKTGLAQVAAPLERCPVCGGVEFFIRRDFPQKLGLFLVVLFGVIASIFYYLENVPATFGTLASLVVIDAIIYLLVGKVTVCYRCRTEYRGTAYNPAHEGFDLATSEKYGVTP